MDASADVIWLVRRNASLPHSTQSGDAVLVPNHKFVALYREINR